MKLPGPVSNQIIKQAYSKILVWMISRNFDKKMAYREIFLSDKRNTAKGISAETFTAGMRKLGFTFDDLVFKYLFKHMDENGDGYIDLHEWMDTVPDRIITGINKNIKDVIKDNHLRK